MELDTGGVAASAGAMPATRNHPTAAVVVSHRYSAMFSSSEPNVVGERCSVSLPAYPSVDEIQQIDDDHSCHNRDNPAQASKYGCNHGQWNGDTHAGSHDFRGIVVLAGRYAGRGLRLPKLSKLPLDALVDAFLDAGEKCFEHEIVHVTAQLAASGNRCFQVFCHTSFGQLF
jgi:hypothetical protein